MGVGDWLRTVMCWGTAQLLEHEQCVKFLTDRCEAPGAAVGACRELEAFVKKECDEGRGSDKDRACLYSEDLGIYEKPPTSTVHNPPVQENTSSKPEPEQTQKRENNTSKAEPKEAVNRERPSAAAAKAAAPRGAPAASPSPAPQASPAAAPWPAEPEEPFEVMDKKVPEEGLWDQGFDGHSSERVVHKDAQTQTSDWGKEWPQKNETEEETQESICKKQPELAWCRSYLRMRDQEKAEQQEATEAEQAREEQENSWWGWLTR